MNKPWNGKPRWNGKQGPVELTGCVLAMNPILGPVLTMIDGCNDYFLPIFSDVEALHAHIKHIQRVTDLGKVNYTVKKVDEPGEFLDSIREAGVRIMLDPVVVNDNHTKWKEVVRDGEQWKFVDPEVN